MLKIDPFSVHEIVAPYITPSIQDVHHSSYRSTYPKSLITKIDFINAMRWTWLEGDSPAVVKETKWPSYVGHFEALHDGSFEKLTAMQCCKMAAILTSLGHSVSGFSAWLQIVCVFPGSSVNPFQSVI